MARAVIMFFTVAMIRRMPGRMMPFRLEKQTHYPSQDSSMGFMRPLVIVTAVVVPCVMPLA
jgi:hypothetical protein